ncbi:glutathione-specific gamma-glutamylcyclotransferase [Physcia stellaris]|nr:glutathione-specific gamma-glutamylcyclotransferase [Physcia stellaris]
MTPSPANETNEFWLFGYGSLIWKPPPHYVPSIPNLPSQSPDLRLPGYITGYVRRFWQASEDHRGTPASPGRVVTLIEQSYYEKLVKPEPNHPLPVHGAAYRIPPQHVAEVSAYLDLREINGYSIQYTDFYPSVPASGQEGEGGGTIRCLVYIGLPTNPQFLGVQPPERVAEVIRRSRGPSGENSEYLFMLERALEGFGEGAGGDEHVSDLARRVRALEAKGMQGGGAASEVAESRIGDEAVSAEFERVHSGADGSHGVQEETEKP